MTFAAGSSSPGNRAHLTALAPGCNQLLLILPMRTRVERDPWSKRKEGDPMMQNPRPEHDVPEDWQCQKIILTIKIFG
jgi:hypothetical protein